MQSLHAGRSEARNEQLAEELAWQSREAEKWVRRADKLASENKSLRRENKSLLTERAEQLRSKAHPDRDLEPPK